MRTTQIINGVNKMTALNHIRDLIYKQQQVSLYQDIDTGTYSISIRKDSDDPQEYHTGIDGISTIDAAFKLAIQKINEMEDKQND